MYRSMSVMLCSVSLVLALAGCGGGGGGEDSGPALTFNPATMTANYAAGTTQTVMLTATATKPSNFGSGTLYVRILNADTLISSPVAITQIDEKSVRVTLKTLASTAPGHYTGNFTVQLCRNDACTTQFPGSPVLLPYDITVTPASIP